MSHDSNLNILRFFFSFGGYRVLLSLPVQLQHTQTHTRTYVSAIVVALFVIAIAVSDFFICIYLLFSPSRFNRFNNTCAIANFTISF